MGREVVDFDDVDTSSQGYALLSNGYDGLDWKNFGAVNPTSPQLNGELDGSGYPAGVTSGSQVGFSYYAQEAGVSLTSGSFTLKSVELTAAWDTKLTVEIVGYRDGTVKFDKTVHLTDSGPELERLNFKGVDDVVFKPRGATPDPNLEGQGKHIVFDDLIFSKIKGADEASVNGHGRPASTSQLHGLIGSSEAAFGEHAGFHPAFTSIHGVEHLAVA